MGVHSPRKVVIVGAGAVGATFAYALAREGVAEEELAGLRHSADVLQDAWNAIQGAES